MRGRTGNPGPLDVQPKGGSSMLMQLIPTRMHAAMDYLVGVLLIAAPWIFQYADETTAGTWISVVAGLAMIGMSLMTDYEGGVVRMVAMRVHLLADAVLGVFLAVSPWLFGFADEGANAWVPFIVIGVLEVGTAMATDPDARAARTRRSHVHA